MPSPRAVEPDAAEVIGPPFDVAIAGAGLAGGSLALRLARAGARVALIDAGTFPRPKLCGEYLSPEGAAALERLGLGPDVQSLGAEAITRVRLTTPRGRELVADVAGPDGRPGLGLSRLALDELLVTRAVAAGVTLLDGHRVLGPVLDGDRVVGVRARPEGQREAVAVAARIVVAADGRGSALVRQTGTVRPRSRLATRPGLFGLKRHLDVPDPDATEPAGMVGLHLVAGGYGGTCRIEGGRTNLCALLPESALQAARGDLDRVAATVLGSNPVLARLLAASAPVGPWKTVAGVRVEVATPRCAGILYAGDCQGTVDPLGGQGMTMALLGAEGLAVAVLEALGPGAGGVTPATQGAVQAAWRRRFDRRVNLCRLYHHALVRPTLLDLASRAPRLSRRGLALAFHLTRDPAPRDPVPIPTGRA